MVGHVAIVSICCMLVASGCGPYDDDRVSLSISVDTVAGIERVRSSGDPPEWQLDSILALGSIGSATSEAAVDEFAWVSSVAIGPDGNLYVGDLGNYEVRVFDISGALVRTIGREGSGPGEFGAIYSVQWLGDTLAVLDQSNGRIGFFSKEGEWLDHRPSIGRLTDSPVTTRLYAVGNRELYQRAYRAVDGYVQSTWLRHDATGTATEWPRDPLHVTASFPDKVVCTMGRGFSWFDHPYATRSLEHPAPGSHVYLATTDAYRVVLVNSRGDTMRIIERAAQPPPLTDAAWEEVSNRFDVWLQDKDPAQCRPPVLHRPANKPYIESLMVDTHGRLWVERNIEAGTRWEIYDHSGRPIAYISGLEHDRQRTVPWLSDDYVAWVRRGPLDEPSVHVARIAR
jgi:hypothetical protein